MQSLWEQTWGHPSFTTLEQDITTNVLIIGGGMSGVLCAYFLHQAGIPYILVEEKTICSGITKNTTAKLTSQHGIIYHKLIQTFGVDRAQQYLSANEAALQKYQELCRHIDCDFEEKSAYVFTLHDKRKLEQELIALEKLHFCAEFVDHLPLPFAVAGAIKFPESGSISSTEVCRCHFKGSTRLRTHSCTRADWDHSCDRSRKDSR